PSFLRVKSVFSVLSVTSCVTPQRSESTWEEGMAANVTRRHLIGSMLTAAGLAHPFARRLAAASASMSFGAEPELQPLLAQERRLVDAMAYLGEPFGDAERRQLETAANMTGEPQ